MGIYNRLWRRLIQHFQDVNRIGIAQRLSPALPACPNRCSQDSFPCFRGVSRLKHLLKTLTESSNVASGFSNYKNIDNFVFINVKTQFQNQQIVFNTKKNVFELINIKISKNNIGLLPSQKKRNKEIKHIITAVILFKIGWTRNKNFVVKPLLNTTLCLATLSQSRKNWKNIQHNINNSSRKRKAQKRRKNVWNKDVGAKPPRTEGVVRIKKKLLNSPLDCSICIFSN